MATPGFVQSVLLNSTKAKAASKFYLFLPNKSLAGNCIITFVRWSTTTGTPVIVISDDQSNTWVAGPTHTLSGHTLAVYYALNCAANTRKITIDPGASATIDNVQAGATEFYNIATSSAADGSAHANGVDTVWSPGAFSTGTADSLVYGVAVDAGGFGPFGTIYTAASGFTLTHVNDDTATAVQWKVQTAAGSVTAAITSGNATFIACALGLKSASAGTAPTADPRIIRVQWVNIGATVASQTLQFPCSGNAIVASWLGGGGFPTALTMSDSKGNGYGHTPIVGSVFAGGAQFAFAARATTGTDLIATVQTTAARDATIALYDFQGTGCQFRQLQNATGLQSDGGNLSTVSIAPVNSKGVIFLVAGINAGALRDLIGASYLTDMPWFPEGDGGGTQLAEDNGWGHIEIGYDKSTRVAVWDNSRVSSGVGNGVQDWAVQAIEFSVLDLNTDYSEFPVQLISDRAKGTT